jgi:glycosyltransferase involved in cell wall biosynthesis
MSYELSVIIPVYNVERYIEQCLESVVNQSLGIENIEVIVVNDQTPDNSMSIVEKYAQKYPSIKIVTNEVNKGLGLSRNAGLSNATSDYVTFLDSDDFISLNTFEDSITKLKDFGCDLLIYNWKVFTDDGPEEPLNIHNQNTNEDKVIEDIAEFPQIFLLTSACNKIYHKSLFKYLNYEKGLYEDNIVTASVLLNSNKIFLSKDSTYFYRKNSSSITESIGLDNVLDLSKSIKLLFALDDEYPNYFSQIKLLIIKFIDDVLFLLFNHDWTLNEELLIVDNLKSAVGDISQEDLNNFNEIFPDYQTSYIEECLDLHELSSELFLAKYKYFNRLPKVKSQASLYIDDGNGFSEASKIGIDYVPQKENKLTFDLSQFSNIHNLRFDPLEGAFIKAKINNLSVIDSNCDNSIDDEYQIFLTLDPSYILDCVVDSDLTIDFNLEFIDNSEMANLFAEKNNIINELNNKSSEKRFKFL